MPRVEIKIDSVLGGISPFHYAGSPGTYNSAIAIDPDFPITDGETGFNIKTAGILRPTATADFSSTNLTEAPYWITTSPKTALLYVYASNGRLLSYSTALTAGSESLIGTATSGAGNGMAYYNNYLYLATPTDVSRYGPLNGTPSLTNTVWTGSTLGTQTALTNTTYPNTRGSNAMPNHPMHVHVDNKLYVGDFINGQGLIHFIKTSKTTDEGDTNDGSTYNVLDLPWGYMPTCFASYGNLLVIGAIQTSNATFNQGKAVLFFWNTVADSFDVIIELPDPIVSAIKTVDGRLYIWSGSFSGGCRLSVYLGGNSTQQLVFQEEQYPPLAGAVDAVGDRVYWGSFTTYPASNAVVWAYGSKLFDINAAITPGLHCVFTTTSSGANQIVTSLKFAENANFIRPRAIIGWTDDA